MGRRSRFATALDAEKWAVSKGAPARGTGLAITSKERGLVKFWLTACGVSSERAGTMTLSEMSAAWHDTTGHWLSTFTSNQTEPKETIEMQEPIILLS